MYDNSHWVYLLSEIPPRAQVSTNIDLSRSRTLLGSSISLLPLLLWGGETNQYWSVIGPVLVTMRSSTGHYCLPLLVHSETSTGWFFFLQRALAISLVRGQYRSGEKWGKEGEDKVVSVWHNVRCLGVRLSVYRLIYKLFWVYLHGILPV